MKINCIGLMSGTSLDGLDIVYCSFYEKDRNPRFEILASDTILYSDHWRNTLSNAQFLSAYQLGLLNNQYGLFLGQQVNAFIEKHQLNKTDIAFIASHGHTVFHNPNDNITLQIGDGTAIYTTTGIKTIYDFRRLDVCRHGQGAPLVPIGDQLLFFDFDFCLNLGGFANISYAIGNNRIAFDIVPVNIVLNNISQSIGLQFDSEGTKASQGQLIPELLEKLNSIEYYFKQPPKSLGREWVEQVINPIIIAYSSKADDILRTYVEHVCIQIANAVSDFSQRKILVTGGGAYNTFLINRFRQLCKHKIFIPDNIIVDYKEALIFAFLGYLKTQNRINTLASVTGATCNSISGIIIEE